MAEVHTADDPVLDRMVVVKLLAPQGDPARFEREARAAAALTHPNIVELFDYGDEGGRPYIVFEYLEGKTLEQRLVAGRPLADEATGRIAADIAAALAHAHERGVIHRDLKPGNVLFDAEDRAKIADFGIAHVRGADTITDAGTILGTAAYISPEQVRGEPATAASDVYSFGVVLYRLLSGRLPFESASATELAAMHRDAEPPALATIRADVPAELELLAMAALAKAPSARPPNGAALLDGLGSPKPTSSTEADTRVIAGSRPRRRLAPNPLVAVVVFLLLAVAGVLSAAILTNEPASSPGAPVEKMPAKGTSTATTAQTTAPGSSSTTTSTNRTTTEPATAPTARSTRDVTTTTAATTAVTTTTTETTVPSTSETTTPIP